MRAGLLRSCWRGGAEDRGDWGRSQAVGETGLEKGAKPPQPTQVLAPEGFRAQGSWGDAWGAIASIPFSKPQCTPAIRQASKGVQTEA